MKLIKRGFLILLLIVIISIGFIFVSVTFYKKELTQLVINDLKLKYGLSLLVEDINVSFLSNWPHTSVQLKKISVSSERNNKTGEAFLKAGSLAVSFNLLKMLRKQFIVKYVSLKDVELNLVKYADGTKNFEFKKGSDTTQSQSGLSLNLDKISLKNVKFKFSNEGRGQNIGIHFIDNVIRLKNYEEGIGLKMQGDVVINHLLFNPQAGEFLSNTKVKILLEGTYFNKDKSICVTPPSYAEIEDHRYNLSSIIKLSDIKKLYLTIESKAVNSEQVAVYLTPKIKKLISNFKLNQTVDAKFILVAKLGVQEEPVIIADVIGNACDLKIGKSKIPYANISFKGRVLSLHQSRTRGDMEQAKVTFDSIKGTIYDFPFTADVKVLNLRKPIIDLKARIVVDGKNLKQEETKNMIIKGTGIVDVHYSGNTRNLSKEKFLNDSMYLKANLSFTDLSYKKIGSNMEFVFNGKADLDRDNLSFENLRLKTIVGDIVLKGKAEQFLKYVIGITNVLKIKIDARTNVIDLNPLFTLGSKTKKGSIKNEEKTDLMKRSIFDIDLNLKTPKLLFRKIETRAADIRLNYKKDLITISQLHLHACEGEINLKGTIADLKKINTNVIIKNVDATQLFMQFENFGQEAIKSENIKGKIFVDGDFSAELNEENKFKGESLKSDVTLKIKEGHLINFEPLQNISNFVMKRRDVKDVSFSELKETFKVRGFEIKIDELEIASSLLNLYIVNGLYSIKGNSNINMLIPWSNLKRLGPDFIPIGSGKSAENARGLKLNYSGPAKKMKLSLGHKEQEKRFW